MRRVASSQTTGAALLIVGIVVGAALIFVTLFATGSLSPKTITETATKATTETTAMTSIVTTTTVVTSTFTVTSTLSESFTGGPRVSMVSANLDHTGAVGGTLVFTNSGSVDATILYATITYSSHPNTALTLPATTTIAATGAAVTITLPVETLTGAVAGEAFNVNLVIQPGGGSISGTGTFS